MSEHIELVEAVTLRAGLSPRTEEISPSHVRQLVEVGETLPPILVQRSSMRIVDGMHRLHAARERKVRFVQVVYFDGSDEEAFVEAVRINAVHGLPLSSSDRAAAVERILRSNPEWSDRRIASICGVAAKTVARLRLRSTDDGVQVNIRIGLDGRRHPVSVHERRRLAEEIFSTEPTVSVRAVAQRSGISVGTAAGVRRRLTQAIGDSGRTQPSIQQPCVSPPSRVPTGRALLDQLLNDPSLRYNDRGRALLRLLGATLTFTDRSAEVAQDMPQHCHDALRTIAEVCAAGWQDFGDRIKSDPAPSPSGC